jgi:aspartyl protease family protein
MMRFAVIAVVACLSAFGAAKAVLTLDQPKTMSVSPVAAETAQAAPPPTQGQPAQVVKAADGHYWAEALVDGRQVRFLVDTGATAVALTPEDARRLGHNPATLDYGHTVMTASGEARAARLRLASVSVAGAKVTDVEAFVIEKGLDTSLLGMTYMGRLSSFEATRTALILRP